MKISTISNVLNSNILDIVKLNAQVFQGNKKNYNVTNDEEGESNQENNIVTFDTHIKDMKGTIYTGEPSNSKNICVTHIHKTECTMSGNMSQLSI